MLLAIALGGAAGSLARYGLGGLIHRYTAAFPLGTLVVNVSGSFLLGFLVRFFIATPMSPALRAGLTIGFCGGFTTFSTFGYEAARLIEDGSWSQAGLYIIMSVFLSMLAIFAGFALARLILPHV